MTAPNLAAGQIVGGTHTIQGILRHNGLTATYRALTRMGRDVALKVVDPVALSHPEIVARLKASESSTNALPGTMALHVLESGTDPTTGAPFLVTDFSPHPSLEDLLSLCPLPPPDAITVVRKLAHAIDAAHALGMAHLGLKPSNVFVGPAPACDTRIGDFGVVVVRTTLRAGRDPAPIDFPWMAPEQADPGRTAGMAADIFSLGLVAFFAFTGHSYWRSCQGTERDIDGWKREIAGGPASASARAKALNVMLGIGADAVFGRALMNDEIERYATAVEFAEALAVAIGAAVLAEAAPPAVAVASPVVALALPAAESSAVKPGGARKMTMMGMAAGGGQRGVPRPASAPAPAQPAAAPGPVQSAPMTPEAAPPPVQFAPPPVPPAAPQPMPGAPVQAAPAQTPPPTAANAARPAATSAGDDEPINSIAGVPRRKGARVALIAAITAVAFVVFGAIAWGAISLVMSLMRPEAKPAASAVVAPASARAPVQPALVASALPPAEPAPPVAPAAAVPAEKPPVAEAPAAPKKPKTVAPGQPTPAPKPAAKPAPAKPAKKCGTFLKKC